MTLNLKNNFIASANGGSTLYQDTTGSTGQEAYSRNGNIVYSAVDTFRLRVASLTNINNIEDLVEGDSFVSNTEYICTSGPAVIDSKTIDSGQYFVPMTSGLTVPAGSTFSTTGYFIYIPTSYDNEASIRFQVPIEISLAEINQPDNTYVQDDLYVLDYEVYYDVKSGTTAAVDGQQYIVFSGTATYDGNTYRVGEVFIATDTTNITTTGTFCLLYASKTTYFILTYNMLADIFDMLPYATEDISRQLYDIKVQLESLSHSCQTGNVSFIYTKNILEKLQGQVTYLKSITI